MSPSNKERFVLGIGLISIFFVVVTSAGFLPCVSAQETEVKIKEIKPAAPFQTKEGVEFPEEFDGKGRIDRVGQDEFVIADKLLKFSFGVRFHTQTRRNVSRYNFSEGDFVGYLKNERNELVAVWKLTNP
ncbi:MAG: hypothetical protein JSU72_01195 [Deltaproteobacteria bacterium]|nr:MAG: hypothetical protein JSU72_01195 [Deltaproteobacteria bacterium]